jgi:hypothetical protein
VVGQVAVTGRLGKRVAELKLHYAHKSFGASLLRNLVKFLPWQLGHIGTIRGIYTDFDTVSAALSFSAMALGLVLLVMGLARRDKRHLGDVPAGTQTQVR